MAGSAIRIAILANAAQAKKELNDTASVAERISGKFSRLRVPATAALGAIGLGAKESIRAASDLNETVSKTDQIFGAQSAAVKKFASGAATSLGQSKTAALDAAANFGLIGQKAGLSGSETAKFATQFTTLASDLASFNNTTPEEAVQAIGAAMRGESEPIRKYGVLLDDATLRARALKLGLIDNVKQALTPQQKALAASQEIMAQTTKAQGDFARTSEGAANKQRILAAQSEDLKAKLGQGLLPTYQAALNVASRFAAVLAQNPATVKAIVAALAALAAVILVASAAQKVYTAGLLVYKGVATAIKVATIVWRNAQLALNIAMYANPIGVVIAAIVALVAVFVIAYKKSETFRRIVNGAWSGIKAASVAVFGFLKNFITGTWNAIRTAVTSAVSKVKAFITGGWNAVRSATTAAWNGIKTGVRTAINAVMDLVRGIKGRVTGALSGAGSWLLGAGKAIIRGLISGIDSMIDTVLGKLRKLTSLIPKVKGPPRKDAKLLKPAGELIIQGLIDGFDRQIPNVKKTLGALSKDISTFDASPSASLSYDASVARGGTAGASYSITVQAPVGSSSADIGRSIVKHIEAYERAGGRRRA